MRVACFCGVTFDVACASGTCPRCGELAYLPKADSDLVAMAAELQAILGGFGETIGETQVTADD